MVGQAMIKIHVNDNIAKIYNTGNCLTEQNDGHLKRLTMDT